MASASLSSVMPVAPIYTQPCQEIQGILSSIQILDDESLLARIHTVDVILPADLEVRLIPFINEYISLLRIDDRYSVVAI